MLVVLDCNVIISAGLTSGACRAVVREVLARHRCVLSDAILREYREVAGRPRFASLHAYYGRMIGLLEAASVIVEPGELSLSLPDSDDEIYLAAALRAGAPLLVTGNTAHFPDGCYGATRVVTPRQFLDRVADETR